MRFSKRAGGNRATLFSAAMETHFAEDLDLLRDLRHALDADGFELAFQPKIDAASGRIELVRGTSTRVADRSGANECTDLTTTARITPADSVTQPVLAVSTRSVAALDIWTGDGWLPAGLDAAGAQARLSGTST